MEWRNGATRMSVRVRFFSGLLFLLDQAVEMKVSLWLDVVDDVVRPIGSELSVYESSGSKL